MAEVREVLNRIRKDLKGFCLVAVLFLALYVIIHYLFDAFCPMLVVTGIPCAGCGLTRAALYLLKGQVIRAANINPTIFPMIAFLLYCGYFRYVRGTEIKGLKYALMLLAAFAMIIYVKGMYQNFPDQAPYAYHKNNICSRLVPDYGEWMARLFLDIRSWRNEASG